MTKITSLTDLTNLSNEQTVVAAINSNNTAIENAMQNTLSRDGSSPNQMEADLDMNSNQILNLPDATTDQEPATYGQLLDAIDNLEAGAVLSGDYVLIASDPVLTEGRVLTAGTNIEITDGGAGTTVTLDLPDALDFTGKTITGGTFTGGTSSFEDDTFEVVDNLDNTKKMALQVSGVTTGTTRTLTVPNADTTIVGTDATQTLSNKSIDLANNTVTGTTAQFNTALSDNNFATLTGSETLTNKTIALGSNTVSGTTAQFNTALSDNDFATLAGSETLTNKTLTAPVISTISNTGTVTLPTATTTLVGRDTTDTLTNKTLTSPVINVGSDAQGDVYYRNGSGAFTRLAPGVSGTFLKTQGAGANPIWDSPAGAGTVTSVVGNGVTITASGTIPPPVGLVNHSLAVSAAGGALTIALKDAAGSDPSATSPVNGYFRNVTTTTGSLTQLTVTGALSLTVSSGSTLGVTSSTAFRLWVVLFNDGGTARLGVINTASTVASPSTHAAIYPLQQSMVASSTAEGGAGGADTAGVIYTGTAVTSKAYLIVGYLEWSSSGLTAGTWTTTNLLYVHSFGPGTRLPGEVVQATMMSNTTSFSTTSSTFQTSNVSTSISPTSAANFVRVVANGTGFTGAANAASLYIKIFRGATELTPQFNALGSTGVVPCGASFDWLDNPNTTSSTTYSIKIKNDDNATTVRFPVNLTGASGQMVLYEVMT